MKKIPYKFTLVLFFIFIFFFLLNNSFGYLDPDFGWHLKVGEEILQNKDIPHVNYYNYTIFGQNWVDHEWLMDAITYFIFSSLNYTFLNIFFALIIIFVLIIQLFFAFKNYAKNNNDIFLLIFLQLFGIMGMSAHLGVRMQEITLLFLLFLTITIYYFNKYKRNSILWVLIPLFFIWANLHAGFLIGFFILFAFFVVKSFEILVIKKVYFYSRVFDSDLLLSWKNIFWFCIFSLLAFAGTLLNPYKLELYSFLSGYKDTYYLTHIDEWLPQYFYPYMPFQIFYIALIVIIIFYLMYYSVKKREIKINIWDICITFFFIFLSIKSKRHFPLLYIISLPMAFYFMRSFFDVSNITIKNKYKYIISIYFYSSVILLIALFAISTKYTNKPFESFCHRYPCRAIKFLKENYEYDEYNIYNNYDWGGYLIWEYPERKLFIDGRLPQFEFNGHTMLEEYHEFFQENKQEEKLNKYNIRLVFMDALDYKTNIHWVYKKLLQINEEAMNDHRNYLREYLDNSSEWEKVYSDKISVIYAKK